MFHNSEGIPMHITRSLLCAASLLAFGAGPASAGILKINVNAHVTSVDDPYNVLGGQVSVGQEVTGSYGYETTVPNSQPGMPEADYVQTPAQGSMSFSVGPFTFASDPLSPNWAVGGWWYWIAVREGSGFAVGYGFEDYVRLFSQANQPFGNGMSVYMSVNFTDPSNMGLNSDALPAGALDLTRFTTRQVNISGNSPNSYF